MPSIKRSNSWFVRVDYPRAEVSPKMKLILGWIDIDKCLGVFHTGKTGENPHFHMILTLKSELQKQSLDTRFKNMFQVKGSQYSSKPWDGKSGAGSYLFHEDNHDIVINRGFSDEDIAEFKRLNEEVKKVIEVNKERGTNRAVQRIIDKVVVDCSRRDIFDQVMDSIRNGEMYHPGFRMSAIVDEIYVKSRSDASWEDEKYSMWLSLAEKNKW